MTAEDADSATGASDDGANDGADDSDWFLLRCDACSPAVLTLFF
jgi:hypothetical protein